MWQKIVNAHCTILAINPLKITLSLETFYRKRSNEDDKYSLFFVATVLVKIKGGGHKTYYSPENLNSG